MIAIMLLCITFLIGAAAEISFQNLLSLPPLVPENWMLGAKIGNQDPYHCFFEGKSQSVLFSHSCRIHIPIELDNLYNYVPEYYASSPYETEMQFQLSLFIKRVDIHLHRRLTLVLSVSLTDFFTQKLTLTKEKLDYGLKFNFGVPIPTLLIEAFHSPERFAGKTFTTNKTVNLMLEFAVVYDENVLPVGNYIFEEAIFLSVSNFSIKYVPTPPKYELIPSIFSYPQINSDVPFVDNSVAAIQQFGESNNFCNLLGFPDANVLNQIKISDISGSSLPISKVFCGIYTTENQHNINVKVNQIGFFYSVGFSFHFYNIRLSKKHGHQSALPSSLSAL
jgi:hypothetical protein